MYFYKFFKNLTHQGNVKHKLHLLNRSYLKYFTLMHMRICIPVYTQTQRIAPGNSSMREFTGYPTSHTCVTQHCSYFLAERSKHHSQVFRVEYLYLTVVSNLLLWYTLHLKYHRPFTALKCPTKLPLRTPHTDSHNKSHFLTFTYMLYEAQKQYMSLSNHWNNTLIHEITFWFQAQQYIIINEKFG